MFYSGTSFTSRFIVSFVAKKETNAGATAGGKYLFEWDRIYSGMVRHRSLLVYLVYSYQACRNYCFSIYIFATEFRRLAVYDVYFILATRGMNLRLK